MQLKHLPNIKSPQDIRNYSDNELRELCDEIRQYTIDTVTEIGGHLASGTWRCGTNSSITSCI
ncbi:MAG: hypothetical protein CM1200mP10_13710 [Candidatus Neomarinimicrobiota bacterium]|nr:MAG: hypothetical protein CM1200mP10_13710 [Candidatus Neomarinimicrobiota bacterium]